MARPTTAPRLSTIDPAALATEVARAAIDHLAGQIVAYGALDDWRLPSADHLLTLRHAVSDLAHYARDGASLDAPVEEYLLSLLPLWQYAAGGASVATPELDAALAGDLAEVTDCWQDRLMLVCVAALGRQDIEQGSRITVARLAALASVTPQAVRTLARAGELRLSDDPLSATAREARRWLGARGITTGGSR